jgi:hypothetical protein
VLGTCDAPHAVQTVMYHSNCPTAARTTVAEVCCQEAVYRSQSRGELVDLLRKTKTKSCQLWHM